MKKLMSGVFLASAFLFSGEAEAASCTTNNCTGAQIQAILVNWEDNSVKVRFDGLTGLSCDSGTISSMPAWEVKLSSTDPQFQAKYSLLLTAWSMGKPIWFYVTSTASSSACEFGMVAVTN